MKGQGITLQPIDWNLLEMATMTTDVYVYDGSLHMIVKLVKHDSIGKRPAMEKWQQGDASGAWYGHELQRIDNNPMITDKYI